MQITISCATPNADIYYTEDGSIPSETNGTHLVGGGSFTIDSDRIIKAKAFKNGYNESGVATEIYTISLIQAIVTVTPPGGTYPARTQITITWPPEYECWYTQTEGPNPPDPPVPQTNGYYLPPNDNVFDFLNYDYKYKFKFQLLRNGEWGPVVFEQYDMKPETRVAQIDQEIVGSDNSFGIWHRWENDNHWEPYSDHLFFRPTTTEDWIIQAQQNFKEFTTRKYRVWNQNTGASYFVNHAQVSVNTSTNNVLAYFQEAYDASVVNNLEGSYLINSGYFYFKDPWFIDDYSDPKGPRNRGTGTLTETSINFTTIPNITTNSVHLGVFLNQGLPNWSPPYYSVKTNLTQDLTLYNTGNPAGRHHHFIFQNWGGENVAYEDANARETGIVFTDVDPIAQANYKGTQLSNNQNAYKNSSQRKFVRTPDGRMYITYESMGCVWLEKSTDNGVNWEIMNNGNPIGNTEGISPCLDYEPDANLVVLSWQQKSGSIYRLRYLVYKPSNDSYRYGDVETVGGPPLSPIQYSYDAQMVVSWSKDNNALFVWNDNVYLMYSVCILSETVSDWQTSGNIGPSGSVYNSPTLYCNKSLTQLNNDNKNYFHLAYQDGIRGIHYRKLTLDVSNPNNVILIVSSLQSISLGSGYSNHYYPTITGTDLVFSNNRYEYLRIAWIGYRNAYEDQSAPCNLPSGERRVLFKSQLFNQSGWTPLGIYGNNVISVSTNKGTNVIDNWEPFAIAWSEGVNCGYPNKYIRSHDGSKGLIRSLNTAGSEIQLNNGTDFSSMYVNSFNRPSLPYYFTLSQNLAAGLQKIESLPIFLGREGVITKDSTDFYYAIGDVTLDGANIDFVEMPDTVVINDLQSINEYLASETFNVTNTSTLSYGVQYGIIDSIAATIALSDGSEINFKVEIIDNQTGEVLGIFDEVSYTAENVFQYNNIGYQVDLNGIGNRSVVIRLVVGTSSECEYAISNRYSDTESLNKRGHKQLTFKETMIVKEVHA